MGRREGRREERRGDRTTTATILESNRIADLLADLLVPYSSPSLLVCGLLMDPHSTSHFFLHFGPTEWTANGGSSCGRTFHLVMTRETQTVATCRVEEGWIGQVRVEIRMGRVGGGDLCTCKGQRLRCFPGLAWLFRLHGN